MIFLPSLSGKKATELFDDLQQATEFTTDLKRCSEAMIQHCKDSLFKELTIAFSTFLKKLKASSAKEDATTTTNE